MKTPYNTEIKPLIKYLNQVEEDSVITVFVESYSNEDRKCLTAVKRDLEQEDKLLEYQYVGRTKDDPAKGIFKVKDMCEVVDLLPEHLRKNVSASGFKNNIAY